MIIVVVVTMTVLVAFLMRAGWHRKRFVVLLTASLFVLYLSTTAAKEHFYEAISGETLTDDSKGFERFVLLPQYASQSIGAALDKVIVALTPPGSNSGATLNGKGGGDRSITQMSFLTEPTEKELQKCLFKNDPVCDKGNIDDDAYAKVAREMYLINKLLTAFDAKPN